MCVLDSTDASGWSEHAKPQTKDNVRENKELGLVISTPASQKDWNIISESCVFSLSWSPAFSTLTHDLADLSQSILLSTTPPALPDQPPTRKRSSSEDVNTSHPSASSARPHDHVRPAHQRRAFHAHAPSRPHAPRGGFWRRVLWILHRWRTLVQGSSGGERRMMGLENMEADCEDCFRPG
ncbi:hypothetical protein B0T18DRAFT_121412 [Schizothecium vesticola]|uniref:Uncharacterized protein n=1 Tax=Schizothecium vesticola TaxID=314040 RepID=A0AA40F2U8_9PEZI|nr:hypothetical protein B0T18DRAFT_121412 [Schizothecium vesticola]